MGEKMEGVANKVQLSAFAKAAIQDVQPFEHQDKIQRKISEMKKTTSEVENNIAKAIINKYGFPNNVERQILGSEHHIRYVDLDSRELLAEIKVEFTNDGDYVIQSYCVMVCGGDLQEAMQLNETEATKGFNQDRH